MGSAFLVTESSLVWWSMIILDTMARYKMLGNMILNGTHWWVSVCVRLQIDGIPSRNTFYQCSPICFHLYHQPCPVTLALLPVPFFLFFLLVCAVLFRVQLYYELLSTNTITNANGKMQICQRKQHPLKLISVGIFHFNDDEHFFVAATAGCAPFLFVSHWVLLLQLVCITNVNHISLDHLFMGVRCETFFHPSTQI